jgi:hypothetical protein
MTAPFSPAAYSHGSRQTPTAVAAENNHFASLLPERHSGLSSAAACGHGLPPTFSVCAARHRYASQAVGWAKSLPHQSQRGHGARTILPTRVRRATRALAHPTLLLHQRDHAAPELLALARIDVVFANEGELPVVGDAIGHDACGQRFDGVGFAHQKRLDACRNQ